MAGSPSPHGQELLCPHCKKPFRAELLGTPGEALRGFKCPHCRLFVPSGRAEEAELTT